MLPKSQATAGMGHTWIRHGVVVYANAFVVHALVALRVIPLGAHLADE